MTPEGIETIPAQFRAPIAKLRQIWQAAKLEEMLDGMPLMEFMLRLTLSHPDITTTITRAANLQHLVDNLAVARNGPLPADQMEVFKKRLDVTEASLALATA